MAGYVIHAENLIVDFPSVRALNGIGLDVLEGDIFGLVGPDGAGKTTCIRVLATILKPTSGTVSLFGHDIAQDARAVRGHIGYMSQRFTLYGDLSVYENLRFFADIYGLSAAERNRRMAELLQFARLSEFQNRRAEHLSGGMKQKLALACTLIFEPSLLLLDEPTTGVDPVSRREFWAILSELRSRGITLFVSTPYMDEAERCSRIAFIDGGEIRIEATPAEIKKRYSRDTIELVVMEQKQAKERLERLPYVHAVEVFGKRILAAVDSAQRAIETLPQDLGTNIQIKSMTIKPSTMESAFIELIKSGARDE